VRTQFGMMVVLFALVALVAGPVAASATGNGSASPYYESAIVNWGSGMCLGIHGSSTAGGAHAVQGGCSFDASQTWGWRATTTISGHTYVQLENAHSHLCLGVQGTSTSSGAQLVQGSCSGTSNHSQFWWPTNGGGSTPQLLVNGHSGLCMGVAGSSTSSGASVIQGTCTASSTQSWYFS
jgi:hypothetical protein